MSNFEKKLGFSPISTEAVERYKAFSKDLDALLEEYPVDQRHTGTVFARKLDVLVQQYGGSVERQDTIFSKDREGGQRSIVRKLIDRIVGVLS